MTCNLCHLGVRLFGFAANVWGRGWLATNGDGVDVWRHFCTNYHPHRFQAINTLVIAVYARFSHYTDIYMDSYYSRGFSDNGPFLTITPSSSCYCIPGPRLHPYTYEWRRFTGFFLLLPQSFLLFHKPTIRCDLRVLARARGRVFARLTPESSLAFCCDSGDFYFFRPDEQNTAIGEQFYVALCTVHFVCVSSPRWFLRKIRVGSYIV